MPSQCTALYYLIHQDKDLKIKKNKKKSIKIHETYYVLL